MIRSTVGELLLAAGYHCPKLLVTTPPVAGGWSERSHFLARCEQPPATWLRSVAGCSHQLLAKVIICKKNIVIC